MSKKFVRALFAILLLAAALGAGLAFYRNLQKPELRQKDFERIATEQYDWVFLSTFPIDHYSEQDFTDFYAIRALKASYCIPDAKTLKEYFRQLSKSWDGVTTVYLGIRPDIIAAADLIELIETYPDKQYSVLLSYPSMEYWRSLSDSEYSAAMQSYQDFVNTLIPLYPEDSRLRMISFNAHEWLVGNPANYTEEFCVNPGISNFLLALSTSDPTYFLTAGNYEAVLQDFRNLVQTWRDEPPEYPDFSNWDVVFLGDSIFAYTNMTTSIPWVFSGLTGAHAYNCSISGSSAAENEKGPGIATVTDAFLAKDLSFFEEGTLVYDGLSDYIEHADAKRGKCFVLNLGLNDFFAKHPIRSEDPYDINTYTGALRTAIDKLKSAYPGSVIILLTPNYSIEKGDEADPQCGESRLLTDYVAGVISLSEEMDIPLFDSYGKLGINDSNHTMYLLDGTHPNQATRYTMATKLIGVLEKQISK